MLSTAYWLTFDREARVKLIKLFTIPRSGGSIVETAGGHARVISDGHTADDLTAINIDVLQKILATNSTDYFALLSQVVANIDKFLEIKESGAVDGDWNFTPETKTYDEEGKYKVVEDLKYGDIVRIKNGEVYKIAGSPGRPKKQHAETKTAA